MNPKLTEAQVQEVRASARAGERIDLIAERLGVKVRPIRMILQGKSWTHLPDPAGAGPVQYETKSSKQKRVKARKPPRPTCPRCGGFVEADTDKDNEPFISCEDCGRLWSGSVTDHEREQQQALKLGHEHEQQKLGTDQSSEMATQEMAAA